MYRDYLPWDFFSAFMGASSTGQILLQDKRVCLTISGHSHIRRSLPIDGIRAITVPIGYGRPEAGDMPALARLAVAEIEVTKKNVRLVDFTEGDICEGLPYSF